MPPAACTRGRVRRDDAGEVGRRAVLPAQVAWLALALVAGCSSPQPIDCAAMDGAVGLVLQSPSPDDPAFRDLIDGAAVALTAGPQGGQHVWVQLHARGLCSTAPRVQLRLVRTSDQVPVGTSQLAAARWVERPGHPGTYTSGALLALVEDDQYCSIVRHGEVRLEVRVDEGRGRVAEAAVTLSVRGWSADSRVALRDARILCCADDTNRRCWPNGPPDGGAATDAAWRED